MKLSTAGEKKEKSSNVFVNSVRRSERGFVNLCEYDISAYLKNKNRPVNVLVRKKTICICRKGLENRTNTQTKHDGIWIEYLTFPFSQDCTHTIDTYFVFSQIFQKSYDYYFNNYDCLLHQHVTNSK